MASISYDPESLVSAAVVLSPAVLGVIALRVAPRMRWVTPVLAAPALLMGLALTFAVLRDGPGYGGIWVVLYGPVLVLLGLLAVGRWYVRGRKGYIE